MFAHACVVTCTDTALDVEALAFNTFIFDKVTYRSSFNNPSQMETKTGRDEE